MTFWRRLRVPSLCQKLWGWSCAGLGLPVSTSSSYFSALCSRVRSPPWISELFFRLLSLEYAMFIHYVILDKIVVRQPLVLHLTPNLSKVVSWDGVYSWLNARSIVEITLKSSEYYIKLGDSSNNVWEWLFLLKFYMLQEKDLVKSWVIYSKQLQTSVRVSCACLCLFVCVRMCMCVRFQCWPVVLGQAFH